MENNDDIVMGFDDNTTPLLKLRLARIPGLSRALVIRMIGQLDTGNSRFFQDQLGKCIGSGFIYLFFDVRSLNYVSSTGIGSFVYLLKDVHAANGKMVLTYPPARVFEVFQLLGFHNFFTFITDYEAAIQYLSSGIKAALQPHPQTILQPGATVSKPVPKVEAIAIFPKISPCPVCKKALKVPRDGRFRCSQCKGIIRVSASGLITKD